MAKSKFRPLFKALHRSRFYIFVAVCAFLAGSGVGGVLALRGSEVISRCAYYMGPPI
jgi:hypothetical protein